jgi:large subunit ribosomal protein L29
MTTAAELRELDDDELEVRLMEYRRELLNLRFQLATGQLDNIGRLGQVRRDIARVLTLLRDHEIALAEGRVIERIPMPVRPPRPARRVEEAEAAPEEDEALLDEHDVDAEDLVDVEPSDDDNEEEK